MALVFAMLLGGPPVVPVLCAKYQVALGDTTGSNYSGTPPFQSSAQRTQRKEPSCAPVALEYATHLCYSPWTCAAEASAPEALPPPSINPADGPTQAPSDASNTTIILAPEAGLGAVLGNNGTAINTTIVQQLTFTGKLG